MLDIGANRIIGQQKVRGELARILQSGRLGHAYLLTGPPGVGKKALALAFAEAVNGVENLSSLGDLKTSEKSSWFTHPDISLFMPKPKVFNHEDHLDRIRALANDPYEIVDYASRPSMGSDGDSKNKNAFYSIDYFREEIRTAATLKPNEGRKNIIILTNIEKMGVQPSNAFLKILEEPSDNLMFILTTDSFGALLPTIVSRCQILKCSGLNTETIKHGLMEHDGIPEDDATFLARISGGNYASTRFYNIATLKQNRREVVDFLRMSYRMDAPEIIALTGNWHSNLNSEGLTGILNMLEVFLRDVKIYAETGTDTHLTNADQVEVIAKFVSSMKSAKLEEMINEINAIRPALYHNVQAKYLLTVLAIRFGYLLRGMDTPLPKDEPWHHYPAHAH